MMVGNLSGQAATADVFDADPEGTRVCELDMRSYGGRRAFCGPCATIRVQDDHRHASELFGTLGRGRVLVIDGGGVTRNALLGATMAARAVGNGWAGAVVIGSIRDTAELAELDFGVLALGTTPRKSLQATPFVSDEPVSLGADLIYPGNWLYADPDGLVVRRAPYVGAPT